MADLNDFRGPAPGERPANPAEDTDVQDPVDAQLDAPAGDEGHEDPPAVEDPRAELARRFAERRAAARAAAVPRSHVPSIDGDEITDPDDPDYIAPAEDDDSAHDRTQQAPVGQAEPARAAAPAAERRFELKVNGNTFQVSRDEMLQYAGIDADDAAGLPEVSLQRAAQMNLAAQMRLEDAKRAQPIRSTDAKPGTPAGEDQPTPDDSQSRRAATPADVVEMIREIQYGDPEEAAAKVVQLLDSRESQRETQRSVNGILGEVQTSIDQFGTEYADLSGDDMASDAARAQMVREIVSDLRAHGITDSEAAQLMANPELASRAYVGARASGLAVRPMKTILTTVGESVRARFGGQKPSGATPQPQQPTSRRDEKRTLVSQPAPSGVPTARRAPGNDTRDRAAVASARIAAMKSARFQ